MNESKRQAWWLELLITLAIGTAAMNAGAAEKAASEWVHAGPSGKLVYKTTPAGDRIMDFSTAGYMGGGVALPTVPAKRTVQPSGGEDDTALIQAAIDAVAAMPLEGGFPGAVLLAPGTFTCSKTISIPVSGVVLRGSGSGADGTTIKMVGSRHGAIVIGAGRGRQNVRPPSDDDAEPAGGQDRPAKQGFNAAQTTIADAYVPSGTATFTVADAKGFAAGDTIAIQRPTTPVWVKFMEMDNLKRDGRPQTWIGQTRSGTTERKIAAISGNKLTLDIPLADSYDAKYLNLPGTTVTKVKPSSPITQVGVEHLHIQCPPLEIAYGQAPYSAIRVGGDDCWVKDVFCEETMNSTTLNGKRITMEQVVVKHTFANLGASKPTDFSIEGSQILLDRCSITGGNMYFVWTTSLNPGPNVLLNCTFTGQGSRVQPHMRWSTGVLVDNCKVPEGGIDFMNRGAMGSGHGWTMGWAVAWNCIAKNYVIQNPPGVMNWAIGCIGRRQLKPRPFDSGPILPEGVFDSPGTPVAPQSLYLAQLAERLGQQAMQNIGYPSNTAGMFAEKSVQRLPEFRVDVDKVSGADLALHRPVNTGSVRGNTREFGGEKAVDGDDKTYWATSDGARRATLEVDMEGPVEINALEIGEAAGLEQHVQEYKVEGQVNSDCKLLSQGTMIGARKVDRFPKVTVWKVRLTILKAQPYPAIRKFGLYLDASFPSANFDSAKVSAR
jgi:hypothetical protein